METDSFFCHLFKQLPETLFQLIGLPGEQARGYRFDSVEVKKSFRIDGLFVPRSRELPLYFLEVQFQRTGKFYANLFAKAFCFLEENDPGQDWRAVAIFESRRMEPKRLGPYEELLASSRVTRIYLDELAIPPEAPPGLGILQIFKAPKDDTRTLLDRLRQKAKKEFGDSEKVHEVIELAEELLIRRFSEMPREEIRKMFALQDIRKTKVWQEAHEEGETELKRKLARQWLVEGKSVKEIAALMHIPVKEARRLVKDTAN